MSQKKILIFDEVTSSLDQNSERLVLSLIFDSDFLINDKIFIFSTHSQILADNCDEIINFNELNFAKKRLYFNYLINKINFKLVKNLILYFELLKIFFLFFIN